MEDIAERYQDLKDKHLSLKKKYCDLEDTNKKLKTRLRSTREKQGSTTPNTPAAVYPIEGIKDITVLESNIKTPNSNENDSISKYAKSLAKENQALLKKCRALELRAHTSNTDGPKRTMPPKKKNVPIKPTKTSSTKGTQSNVVDSKHDDKEHLIAQLKKQLASLELNLSRAIQDQQLLNSSKEDDVSPAATLRIHEELRSKVMQLQLLESKFTQLQTRAAAEHELHKEVVQKLEVLTEKKNELEIEVMRQQKSIDAISRHEEQYQSQRMTMESLSSENLKLQEALERMTSTTTPSIDFNARQAMLEEKLVAAEDRLLQYQNSLNVAEKENTGLKERLKILRESTEADICEKDELRIQNEEYQLQIFQLKQKLSLFSDGKEDADLLRELGRVTKELEKKQPSKEEEGETIPVLKKRIERLVGSYAPAFKDIQRLEKLTKVQQDMNQHLNEELADERKAREVQVGHLMQKLTKLRSVNASLVSSKKYLKALASQKSYDHHHDDDTSLDELNSVILNVWLSNVKLKNYSARVFIVADFYYYESQVSPIIMPESSLDFNMSFKCSLNDSDFFEILKNDGMHFELRQILDGGSSSTVETIGTCMLSLTDLLHNNCSNFTATCSFTKPDAAGIVVAGAVNATVSLSSPISVLFDKIYSEKILLSPSPSYDDDDNAEISITVSALDIFDSTVCSTTKNHPSIHYRFLGFQETVSNDSTNNTAKFKIHLSQAFIDYMYKYKLPIAVACEKQEIGVATITFNSVFKANDTSTMGNNDITYDILDTHSVVVGRINVGIQCQRLSDWKEGLSTVFDKDRLKYNWTQLKALSTIPVEYLELRNVFDKIEQKDSLLKHLRAKDGGLTTSSVLYECLSSWLTLQECEEVTNVTKQSTSSVITLLLSCNQSWIENEQFFRQHFENNCKEQQQQHDSVVVFLSRDEIIEQFLNPTQHP